MFEFTSQPKPQMPQLPQIPQNLAMAAKIGGYQQCETWLQFAPLLFEFSH